jgi:hypothetical protein
MALPWLAISPLNLPARALAAVEYTVTESLKLSANSTLRSTSHAADTKIIQREASELSELSEAFEGYRYVT